MSLKTTVYEKLTDVSNFFTSPLSVSKFLEEGVLTPEEFVQAGDLLVLKCPSWSWHGSKITQKGLPPERQYLLTKNVPSSMRVCALEAKSSTVENKYVEEDDGEGGWIATHCNEAPQADEDIPEILAVRQNNLQGNSLDDEDDEDIPEINLDDMSFEGNGELEDQATIHSENVVKTRTYDISICYDQFHQTPRVWLFGYDEQRRPLSPEAVLQDISQEHAKKTVTIAAHPHTGVSQAYIHPCKHGEVMKKLVRRMVESDKTPRVDQYLFIFLKFIHTAIPTIDYDFTFDMEVK